MSKYEGRLKFLPQHPPVFSFQWNKKKGNKKLNQKLDPTEMLAEIKNLLNDMKVFLIKQEEGKKK